MESLNSGKMSDLASFLRGTNGAQNAVRGGTGGLGPRVPKTNIRDTTSTTSFCSTVRSNLIIFPPRRAFVMTPLSGTFSVNTYSWPAWRVQLVAQLKPVGGTTGHWPHENDRGQSVEDHSHRVPSLENVV